MSQGACKFRVCLSLSGFRIQRSPRSFSCAQRDWCKASCHHKRSPESRSEFPQSILPPRVRCWPGWNLLKLVRLQQLWRRRRRMRKQFWMADQLRRGSIAHESLHQTSFHYKQKRFMSHRSKQLSCQSYLLSSCIVFITTLPSLKRALKWISWRVEPSSLNIITNSPPGFPPTTPEMTTTWPGA